MLIAERASGANRYRFLEIVREFSRARLKESGNSEEARLKYAERMVWLAEQSGLVVERRFAKVAAMVDDIRAALVTLVDLRPKRAAWLAGTLRWFWANGGRLVEGLHWTAVALEAYPTSSMERCWALYGQAILLLRSGRLAETKLSLEEAISLTGLPECDEMRGELFLAQAIVHGGLGDYAAAEGVDRKAIDELTRRGQSHRATLVTNDLATVLLLQGRIVEAQELAKRCLERLRQSNLSQIHFVVETLAQTHAFLGDVDQARACWLESAASLSPDGAEVIGAAVCLEGLAFTAGRREKIEVALRLHSCANRVFNEAEYHYTEPFAPKVYAYMEQLQAEVGPEVAARLLAEGESLTIQRALELANAEG
jgi:tetratricopeptide (TPR) repeat protein